MTWVVGVDGCRAGWVVVFRSLGGEAPRARIFPSGALSEALAAPEHPIIAAVDIPIGLPGVSRQGGRTADKACRKLLPRARKSSIFPPPSRAVLAASAFAQACDIEWRNSIPPKRLSRQTFNILGKIREVDGIAAELGGTIFECHPEISFWAMNGGSAMQFSKKSRRSSDATGRSGSEQRHQLLLENGYSEAFLSASPGSSGGSSRDDLLDACAAAWTAERIATGAALRFPPAAELDGLGIDMAIWA